MPLRVIKRADTGTLWIVGTVTPAGERVGQRVRVRAGSDSQAAAEEEARALEIKILRDFHIGIRTGTRHTFADACASYLKYQERSTGTKDTVRRLALHFRTTLLAEVTQEAVDHAREKIMRPGASDAAWRKVLSILTAIMNHAARRKWCEAPAYDLPRATQGRTAFLTPDEYEALEAAAAPHLKPLLRYLVCTGARLGETLALDWSQVDLSGKRVVVWADQTKAARRRIVDLPPAALLALVGLPHRDGAVFRTRDGTPYRSTDGYGGQIKRAWKTACRGAEIAGDKAEGPHVLRHTFASWHYAEHRDLLALKSAGDWSSVTLVERYAHLVPADEEAGIRRVWGLDVAVRKVVG